MLGRFLARRGFLAASASAALSNSAVAQLPGVRPPASPAGVKIVNPRSRVPVSLIVDDSTCLVNLAHFAIPQFAEVFPDRYKQDWRKLPREIPDAFVRKFAEWCREHGVKGKYSIVPHPACVGWMDGDLPGWTRRELQSSLDLVRSHIVSDWDIHPEMVSHTWVIDTKTGRPYSERSERFMENWRWTDGRSADEIANYMAYALRILQRTGLNANGVTTPGGFGNRALPQLSQASFQACRDVFGTEIPHYFRHLYTDDRSVAPRVENAAGLDGPNPSCVVSIVGCTGDWFGGWDGLEIGGADLFIAEDGRGGRLPQVFARGEPAILVCHWPGIYCNGDETGFKIFQEVVERLHAKYDNLIWMKLSEIARYWAAKELTAVVATEGGYTFRAPFACPAFTVEFPIRTLSAAPKLESANSTTPVNEANRLLALQAGSFHRHGQSLTACFDLPKGESTLRFE